MNEVLDEILSQFLAETHTGITQLSRLSKVPRKTLLHWLNGEVSKPHQWQGLVKVALALRLDEAQANRLLRAGGHESLQGLRSRASDAQDRQLLQALQPPARSAPAPFQAQDDLRTFVGREAELVELERALLASGRAAICGLRGMGGVGKTTLAAHLAHRLRPKFADGVLWAQLDTSDTLSILASFGEAYDKDVSQHPDVGTRSVAIRDLLKDKHVLVVLDNAENSAQVKPLLPSGEACVVLVTTRHDLSATDGWHKRVLKTFGADSGESLQLFERFLDAPCVRRNRVALTEIADVLGHHPLALAISAGQLAFALQERMGDRTAEAREIHDLLETLRRDELRLGRLQRDDQNVRASFNASLATLAETHRQYFSRLGVFGGEDFSLEAAACVLQLDPDTARNDLEHLCARSLVQPSRDGRYHLHELLRDLAREHLHALAEATQVWERMVDFYIELVEQCGQSNYRPILPEMSNILFALNIARQNGMTRRLIHGVKVCHLLLSLQGQHAALRTLIHDALQVARQQDNPAEFALMLLRTCELESEYGKDYALAEQCGKEAFAVADAAGEWETAGRALAKLGMISWYRTDHAKSHHYKKIGLEYAQAHQVHKLVAIFQHNIALDASEQGDFIEAERGYTAFLQYARSVNNLNWIATVLENLGFVAYRQGKLAEAEKHFVESMQDYRDAHGVGHLNSTKGLAHTRRAEGRHAEALTLIEEALRLAEEAGHVRGVAHTLLEVGDIVLDQGQAERAVECWRQGLKISRELSLPQPTVMALCRLSRQHAAQGQIEQAEVMLDEAQEFAKDLHDDLLTADVALAEAHLAAAQNHSTDLHLHMQRALSICDRMSVPDAIRVRAWLEQRARANGRLA